MRMQGCQRVCRATDCPHRYEHEHQHGCDDESCGEPCKPINIVEMGLCEVSHICLKANQLYRFLIMPGCKECERLAKEAECVVSVPKERDRNT